MRQSYAAHQETQSGLTLISSMRVIVSAASDWTAKRQQNPRTALIGVVGMRASTQRLSNRLI